MSKSTAELRALIARARAEGLEMRVVDDTVRVRGAPEVVARWVAVLRPHRAEVLALLRGPTQTSTPTPQQQEEARQLAALARRPRVEGGLAWRDHDIADYLDDVQRDAAWAIAALRDLLSPLLAGRSSR